MVAAYILGTISGVEVLAPTVLAAFGSSSSSTWGNIGIDTALGLVMLTIAIVGIKITARTQIGMALSVALSAIASTGAGIVITARIVYRMATKRVLPPALGTVNRRFSAFYILTALATIAYYRRRIIARPWDLVWLGVLPLGAAGFLGWIIAKSMLQAPASQNWSILSVVLLGIILMFVARVRAPVPVLRDPAGERRLVRG